VLTEPVTYTLAYSPCPNDTFIFAALTNHMLERAPQVRVHFADIEELNSAAARAQYGLTKVSYGAIPFLMNDYRLLRAGGALGRGCGPLVVTRPGAAGTLDDVRTMRVAIPGERTTAFMLLQLALGMRPEVVQMRFDRIIPAVAAGDVDAGLIIHESRFTYAGAGLVSVADLGAWWEGATAMPIPLGGILVRNEIDDARARAINESIRESLRYAYTHEPEIMPFVRDHAFEMSDDVMHKHIALYVNEYSDDLRDEGLSAIEELFRRAREARIIPAQTALRIVPA
jgi:1,4-dihydroxy-6-naphthoate synthase